MAIAFQLKFSDGSTEKYDQVIEKMGFTDGGAATPGNRFHWCAQTDDGLMVVDVWDSAEAFQRFADEQIGPFTAEVGLGPPEITSYEVHNYLTDGGPAQ